jgi:hypothetical protein
LHHILSESLLFFFKPLVFLLLWFKCIFTETGHSG